VRLAACGAVLLLLALPPVAAARALHEEHDAPEALPAPPPEADEEEETAELESLLEEELEKADPPDPLEGMNRGLFSFNRGVDWVLVDPLTRGYEWLVPEPGRRAVRRFFDNLASPAVLVNDLLQLEGGRAARTGGRFLVNTTVGLAGLFDPAERLGLRRHEADFGQTLHRYGVGSGPYLMLPLLGPSSVRDATGRLVDGFLRVDLWLLGAAQIIVLGVADGVSLREMHDEALEELEKSSVDYYSALRSVYWSSRREFLADPEGYPAPEAWAPAEEQPPEPGSGSEPLAAPPQVDSEGPSPRA
jgi:phospholipid-binding lipoprotein MlaA